MSALFILTLLENLRANLPNPLCELDDISIGVCLNLVACEYHSLKTRFPFPLCDRIHLPHLPQMLVNGVESILLQTVKKHGDRTIK